MYVEMSQSADDLYALKKQLEEEGKSNDVEPSTITALLTMADGSTYSATGHLNFTGVDVNQNTNTITLRAQFPNPDGKLLPGLFVNARVIMGETAGHSRAAKSPFAGSSGQPLCVRSHGRQGRTPLHHPQPLP